MYEQNVTIASNESDADRLYSFEHNVKIRVNRPIYTQEDFYRTYRIALGRGKQSPFVKSIRSYMRRECYPRPSKTCLKMTILSMLPFLRILSEYSIRNDLLSDIMAGLIVGFMQIPQGECKIHYYLCILYFHVVLLNTTVFTL